MSDKKQNLFDDEEEGMFLLPFTQNWQNIQRLRNQYRNNNSSHTSSPINKSRTPTHRKRRKNTSLMFPSQNSLCSSRATQ